MKTKDSQTLFVLGAMAVLAYFLVRVIMTATSEHREFEEDCTARGGEVAKQKAQLICVRREHILVRQHESDPHHH